MDYYVCPTCKTENEEYVKYCKKCGTWLLSDAYPAKKVKKVKKAKPASSAGRVFGWLLLIGIIVSVVYFAGDSILTSKISFDDIEIGESFTVRQLEVKSEILGGITAEADVISHKTTQNPLEVVAVFYDGDDRRLGKATAEVSQQLHKGHTATVSFEFQSKIDIASIGYARIEIIPISPLDTLNRFVEEMSKIPIE